MALDTGFSKSIFQSVTFWGAALAAITMLFPTLFAKLGVTSDTTMVLAQHIVQGIGFVITVYGRFRASQPVTITGGAPSK